MPSKVAEYWADGISPVTITEDTPAGRSSWASVAPAPACTGKSTAVQEEVEIAVRRTSS